MLFATPQSTWYWQRAISLESCLKIGHLEAVWDLVWANAHIPSQRYKPAKSGMHELIDSIGSMKIDQFSTHISNLLLLDLTGWTASILQQQVALKEKLTKKKTVLPSPHTRRRRPFSTTPDAAYAQYARNAGKAEARPGVIFTKVTGENADQTTDKSSISQTNTGNTRSC